MEYAESTGPLGYPLLLGLLVRCRECKILVPCDAQDSLAMEFDEDDPPVVPNAARP